MIINHLIQTSTFEYSLCFVFTHGVYLFYVFLHQGGGFFKILALVQFSYMEFLFFLCKLYFRVLFAIFVLLLESIMFINKCVFWKNMIHSTFLFFCFLFCICLLYYFSFDQFYNERICDRFVNKHCYNRKMQTKRVVKPPK